jgi:hypothetical protein
MAKVITKVPVVKHMTCSVSRLGSERVKREFQEDLSAHIAKGFKVYGIRKHGDRVVLEMGKTEEWTLGELLSEIEEQLS